MNESVTFEFSIVKNDRLYRFLLQPGSPWEEMDEVLNEFKEKLDLKRQEAVKAEEARQEPPSA